EWSGWAAVGKRVEGRARECVDDSSQHVDTQTVFPDLARLMGKRQPRQAGDEVLQGAVTCKEYVASPVLLVEFVHGGIAAQGVDEAGCVAQQILDGHRAPRRLERELALPVWISRLDTDHHVLELGKILVDRR